VAITRIFKVVIDTRQRAEFEIKFNTLSKQMLENAPGCTNYEVLRPSKWAPDEYAMMSEWQNESALIAFAGEDWNTSVVPISMKKYSKSHSVCHYESWD